jgi:hypothetical protein
MDRIKFYSINDITYGHHLNNLKRVLREYGDGREPQNINDIIELYNINKFLDNEIFPKEWRL